MRQEYNTRQKREMLLFLGDHELMHFTVDEFVQAMEEQGEKVGRTTAYRFLEALSEQGAVRKYLSPVGLMQYQMVPAGEDCDRHFHLLCKDCGRLFHVDCDLINTLNQHLAGEHGFTIDMRQSVLVGRCGACARGESEPETSEGDIKHGAH